jgi:hypothetical protein
MSAQKDVKKIYDNIRVLKRTAEELNRMGEDFPALARNSTRILASIRMLELNVSDVVELDS